MTARTEPRHLVTLLLLAASCGGGGAGEGDGGDPPPPGDTTAPFTTATPGGGLYPEPQLVTLTASEPATIHYTTDGFPPDPGGATTISAPSPVRGLRFSTPTTLRFRAEDSAGNLESAREEQYDFDLVPPSILIQDFLLGTYGFLDVLDVAFSVDEPVQYLLEVGGDGTPGSGLFVAEGSLAAGVIAHVDLPGYFLPPGAAAPGASVYLHAIDAAGGSSSFEYQLETLPDLAVALPGEVDWMALAADGRRLVLLDSTAQLLRVVDTDPASPTLHQVTATYSVGPAPTRVALSDDGVRAYVCAGGAVVEVDLDAGQTTVLSLPAGRTPSGLAVLAGQRAVLAADDGTFLTLDLDRAAQTFGSFTTLLAFETSMTRGDFAVGADRERALLVWAGDTDFGMRVLDTDLADPPAFPDLLPASPLPANLGLGAVSADSTVAWCPDAVGRLARADLVGSTPSIVASSPTLVHSGGVMPVPGEASLLLTGGALTGIRAVDAASLVERVFVPSGGAQGGTTSEQVLLTPDGTRLYLVRGNGVPGGAELWVLGASAP